MSTPTYNTVPVTYFTPIGGDPGALQEGIKWGGAYGSGVMLTYSFPGGSASHISQYWEYGSYYPLTGPEKTAVRAALAEWGGIANIGFTEVGDGKGSVGDLRFAVTDNAGDEAAHAYYPGNGPEAGDVWFRNGSWHDKPGSAVKPGTYDYLTVVHEIGHALGLKHSFESPTVGKAYDSFAYTIMSYKAAPGSDNWASFYPTTPMYLDIAAIQAMYGRGVHSPGDTVYAFKANGRYWQTIDDSGGNDTIVVKGKGNAVVNLNVGAWSEIGKAIKFSSGGTKKTVMIGPDSVIENAFGGKGKDTLVGNGAGNLLDGGKGRDTLAGGGGADVFLFEEKLKKANLDRITDFNPAEDVIRLAHKIVDALGHGAVGATAFAEHFEYSGGTLSYHGKAIVVLSGAPAITGDDLFVV